MKLRKLLSLLLPLLGLVIWQPTVQADAYTVPMSVLENGTNSTSYAASYFANSATVTTNDDSYTVTSTITTTTDLGDYPVQMLSVDGGGVNISKSSNDNQQTITYSFTTSDIDARHNAVIKVDVDSINYHHTYTVGLQLDTSSLPSLSTDSDAPELPSSTDNNSGDTATSSAKQTTDEAHPTNDSSTTTTAISNSSSSSDEAKTTQSSSKAKTNSEKKTTAAKKQPTNQKNDSAFPSHPRRRWRSLTWNYRRFIGTLVKK